MTYNSAIYGAATSVDFRYAGATTVDTRNQDKIALRGKFADFQTYTFDAGQPPARTNDDWYARDTIGVFFTPTTEDKNTIAAGIARVGQVLDEFMPVTERAVFIRDE